MKCGGSRKPACRLRESEPPPGQLPGSAYRKQRRRIGKNPKRLSEISALFRSVLDEPSLLMREVFPEDLIAAASLVAISLPGGEEIFDQQSESTQELIEDAHVEGASMDLITDALAALELATKPDGHWSTAWIREDDRIAAQEAVDAVRRTLKRPILDGLP